MEQLQEEPGRQGDVKLQLLAAYLLGRTKEGHHVEDVETVLHDEFTIVYCSSGVASTSIDFQKVSWDKASMP